MTTPRNEIQPYLETLAVLQKMYTLLPAARKERVTIPAIFGRSYDEDFISEYLAYILDLVRDGLGIQPLERAMTLAFQADRPFDLDLGDTPSIDQQFIGAVEEFAEVQAILDRAVTAFKQ